MNEEIPESHRIQGLEDSLRTNAATAPSPTSVHQQEERARFLELQVYQVTTLERIFADKEEQDGREQLARLTQIQAWKDCAICVHTNGSTIQNVPLQPLAESCDVVYAMASSWTLFSSDKEKSDMLVSLKEFPEESVQAFLALVNSTATSSNTNVELPGDVVVDCCRIAHYLQNDTILATMTNVLLQSIDTANCLSICQLADSLSLCELFESAVQYLIKSLGMNSKNEDGVNDGEETWDCLTSELQERILAIKAAIIRACEQHESSLVLFILDGIHFHFC
jgi:hypothetical protein